MAEYYRLALWKFISEVAYFAAFAALILIMFLKTEADENKRAFDEATHKYHSIVDDLTARARTATAASGAPSELATGTSRCPETDKGTDSMCAAAAAHAGVA
jgi:hypothetical protein